MIIPFAEMLKSFCVEAVFSSRKARALGCRLLRLRKLCGGHPPLSWDAEERRCSNAAFCTRRLGPIDQPGQESHVCSSCKCAYYCASDTLWSSGVD